VGRLRAQLIAAGDPWVQDAVIAGHDRGEVCALVIPRPGAKDPDLQRLLDALAARSTGSSTRIARAMLLTEPLSIDAGEVTDKGSINQRAVLQCRADLVEMLYREPYGPQVLRAQP
jgi:feruloyl-CoA synthase